jgi:hypothetical protein
MRLEVAMTQITVDADTLAKLNGLSAPLVLCDEKGHVLGRFTPDPLQPGPDDLESDVSYEELRRRAENFRGRPLSDLLAEWERRK